MFKQYHNFLSPELLKTLQESYMRDDIQWTHRNFGRFFLYLEAEHHDQVLDELYYNKTLPTYKNNKMMRHHHMYLQRFVPGSWLPLHRERCYGVLTIYINPDEDWNAQNPAPKFIYYSTQDLHNLEEHKHEYDIWCNSGTYYMTDENDPRMNAYHKVEYNESDKSRYAIQMFFGPGQESQGTMTGNIGYRTHEYRNNTSQGKVADTTIDQTLRAVMSGALELPSLGQMAKTSEEWKAENPEIIERLERDG